MRFAIHALVVVATICTVVPTPLTGQATRLTPADVFRFAFAADAQIAPDGQWIAYVRQWSD